MSKPILLIFYLLGLLATIGGAGGDAEEPVHDWEVVGIDDSRGAGPRLSAKFLLMSSLRARLPEIGLEDCLLGPDPDWHICARIARTEGRHLDSLRLMQGAVRLIPTSPMAHQDIAVLLLQSADQATAEMSFKDGRGGGAVLGRHRWGLLVSAVRHARLACELGADLDSFLVLATALDSLEAEGVSDALSRYVDGSCRAAGGCRGQHIRTAVLEAWRMDQAACAWSGHAEWESRVQLLATLVDNELHSCASNGGAAPEGMAARLTPWQVITYPLSAEVALGVARCMAQATLSSATAFAHLAGANSHVLRPLNVLRPLLISGEGGRVLKIAYLSDHFGISAFNGLLSDVIWRHDAGRSAVLCFAWERLDPNRGRGDSMSSICDDSHGGLRIFPRGAASSELAAMINEQGVNLVVDTLGWLPVGAAVGSMAVLAHRPAPLVVTAEGFHASTGAQFVDYALGDWIATPPEHSGHFSERLILLSASFHANSHASQYSHITEQDARSRCGRGHGQGGPTADDTANLVDLVVPHAFYKLDPHLLSTWRRLVSSPGPSGERARLVFAQKAHFRKALPNIRMLLGGLNASFIRMAGLQETRAEYMSGLCGGDIFLDTPDFNGHTTAVDSVWAGVPIITAATEKMVGRVASSILASADLSMLIARTRGEYAMLGRAMLDSRVRSRLRSRVVEARGTRLFDAETWVRGLEVGMRCAWDSLAGMGLDERRAFHVLAAR